MPILQRRAAITVAGAWAVLGACSNPREARPERATFALSASSREQGEILMARLRCAACHAAEPALLARIEPEAAPDLAQVGARSTPGGLRAWLLDPRAHKPHTAMPDLLAGLGERERASTADDLVQFLAALGGPLECAPAAADLAQIELGRQLFHSVGCVACHAPAEPAEDLADPLWSAGLAGALATDATSDLGGLASTTTIEPLAAFLLDPLAARPSGRMPALGLTSAEAHALAAWLLRGQARVDGPAESPGLACELFEGEFASAAQDFDGQRPVETSVLADLAQLPQHPPDRFALRLCGFVRAGQSGRYEFSTRSDDGSMLWIDGQPVVANDGVHPATEASGAITLERGLHALRLQYFEAEGEESLSVRWQPPGKPKEILPASALSHSSVRFVPPDERFVADAARRERGRKAFAGLGCNACHELQGLPAAPRAAPALARLARHAGRGCLSAEPHGAAPRFALGAEQRALLGALVGDVALLAEARTPAETLHATLARLDCLACHARAGEGGPAEGKRDYFRPAVEVDLGNEGRLPPHLDGVGSKLYADWIGKVLVEGARERPYLATRMPQYGARNVAQLGALFEAVDGSAQDRAAPAFTPERAELGRQLAGAGGLACIQCHVFDGVKSLGIPAVDLAHVARRIKPAWFERLLLDPKSLGMNTRMPIFWDAQGVSAARAILGGDPRQQAEALWSYVSLGRSMPLPDGLVVPDSEFELTPTSEPILCGVFLKDASPRTLLVGTPELVHWAFDLENSRLVCAWRGRFFNAKGTWNGRAGGLEWPASDELLEFPRAPALAFLAAGDAPWPAEIGRAAGFRRLGTRYDARKLPTFRYRLREVEIAESCVPWVQSGAPGLKRRFELRAPAPVDDLYLCADAHGAQRRHVAFERAADGSYAAQLEVEVSW